MDEIFKEVAKLNEISKLQTTDKNNIMGFWTVYYIRLWHLNEIKSVNYTLILSHRPQKKMVGGRHIIRGQIRNVN